MNNEIILKSKVSETCKEIMQITHLTLTDNTIVKVVSRISKDVFKVSYGKDTKGNEAIGLVHRSVILLFA